MKNQSVINNLDRYNLVGLSSEEMEVLNGGSIPGDTTGEKIGYVIGHGIAAVVNTAFYFFVPWV